LRYQRGSQNPYIEKEEEEEEDEEEEQTTQWPKENVQKDKQRSRKHTYKIKDRVSQTPLNSGGELRCSGRVGSSCSTSDTRRVNLFTNPMIRATCSISSILCRHFTFLKLLTFSSLTICYYQLSRHTDVMFHIFAVLVSYSNK
jgi:hypothetical protein